MSQQDREWGKLPHCSPRSARLENLSSCLPPMKVGMCPQNTHTESLNHYLVRNVRVPILDTKSVPGLVGNGLKYRVSVILSRLTVPNGPGLRLGTRKYR